MGSRGGNTSTGGRLKKVLCLVLLMSLPWGLARAQVITGSLWGTVTDESGAPLRGVALTLTSPALLGGPSIGKTNEKGQFRFLALAPGDYRLEIEADGFATYLEEGIRIQVGATVERNVALKLRGVTESIVVSDRSPLIDTRESGVSTNHESVAIRNIPVPRVSVFDWVKLTPGVSATSPTTSDRNVTVMGAGINESTYLLDGTDVTSPRYGIAQPRPAPDLVEEVEIQAVGASAEYGNLQGGVVNIVTRQGGDQVRFDASYYGQWSALTSEPVLEACDCSAGETGFERDLYRDVSAYVGGPLSKERAWLFGGFNIQWDFNSQPGADDRFPSENKVDGVFGKLDWQVTPRLRLMSSLHYNRSSTPGRTASAFVPYETTTTRSGDSFAGTLAQLTYALDANTLWELRASTASLTSGLTPNNGSKTLAARLDLASGVFSGGALYFGDTLERKTDVRLNLSHYAADFLAGDHEFKFGAQFIVANSQGYYGYAGAAHYLDYGGQPFLALFRDTYSYGGAFDTLGFFAEDSVRIGDRLTANLGARFDYSSGRNPDVPEYDAMGNQTGNTIAGRGHLYSWNVFSPRLGVNVKLTRDGRTVLRAFYGRFHPGILTTELQAVSPGFGPITTASYDAARRAYSTVTAVVDPLSNVQIDPGTRSPHTNQYSVGLERGISRDWAIGASYVRRTGGDFTGWKDIAGDYGSEEVSLPDGSLLEVFPLESNPSQRLYLLTNRDDYYIHYDGLFLTAEKRWADRWQLAMSYAYSKATGLQSQNVVDPAGGQGSVTVSFNSFGRDPNDITNATGNLPNDRTHVLQALGSAEIPRLGVLVGAHFQYLTGKPYAALANVTLPQGSRSIYLEPLGSRRLPSQEILDLRVSKIFRVGPNRSVQVLVDVLNVLDDTAEESVATQNFFSPNFAVGTNFVPPRRAMVGVKLSF
jgi:Carboxypeptidase regulatory-like domain/TonB dependent receptor-like, beta-barrel/TonB-dependent Receptor Plug Domain